MRNDAAILRRVADAVTRAIVGGNAREIELIQQDAGRVVVGGAPAEVLRSAMVLERVIGIA